jgi:hypothetical protein
MLGVFWRDGKTYHGVLPDVMQAKAYGYQVCSTDMARILYFGKRGKRKYLEMQNAKFQNTEGVQIKRLH